MGFVSHARTCWLAVVLEHLAEHQLVGVLPERVPEHGCGDQEHVAVGALRLVRTGPVEVPLGKIWTIQKSVVNFKFLKMIFNHVL